MKNIIDFVSSTDAEEILVIVSPVVHEITLAVVVDGARHGAYHQWREKGILEREPQARDAIAEAIQRGGIFHVRECQATVELVHAGLEDGAYRETLHARLESGRRRAALGRHEHHLVPDLHGKFLGQRAAQDDLVFPRLQ